MLDNLSIAIPSVDRIYILSSGILSLTEDLHREEYNLGRSRLKATFSSVQASGLISRLYYEIYEDDTRADNIIEFTAAPSGTEEIRIADIKYKFVSTLSGINQIPLKSTALGNAIALYKVLNVYGTAGTDYYAGQIPHPLVSGLLADNPLYVQSVASGIIGNTYTIRNNSDSQAIEIYNLRFTKGKQVSAKDAFLEGYILCSGNINTTYYLPDLPSSDYGLRYNVGLYFTNSSGYQALNTQQDPVEYWGHTNPFLGRTSLPYYAEVSGLVGSNLVQGKIPSIGEVVLKWNDMSTYSGLNVKLAYPLSTGTPTQSTDYYDMVELGQKFFYIIFVFKASAGASPQRSWPRPTDANGIWYYAGRTAKTNVLLGVPVGYTYSIWVGFGNADTLRTSGLPVDTTRSDIYIYE